jgi:hypothetical protein
MLAEGKSSTLSSSLLGLTLKILLPPHKPIPSPPSFSIHVTLYMQLTAQALRPAEEHPTFARRMNLSYRAEDHIPVRPTEVRRCLQTRDGVGVAAVENDV